jgi:ankyrin repeat protein
LKATTLLLAAQFNKVDIIALYAKDNELNVRGNEGRTVLLNALWGVEEIGQPTLQLLIENGADVNALDNAGQGPLHYCASFNRSTEAVRLLLKSGAMMNEVDDSGSTPLWYAVKNANNYKLVELLLKKGATFRTRPRPTKKGVEKKRIDALLDKKEGEMNKSLTQKEDRPRTSRRVSLTKVDSRTSTVVSRRSSSGTAPVLVTPSYVPLSLAPMG